MKKKDYLLILLGSVIFAFFCSFIYEYVYHPYFAGKKLYESFNPANGLKTARDKTALKITAYRDFPEESTVDFFEKTLKKLGIPRNNIIVRRSKIGVAPPGVTAGNLKKINLDYEKYNVLIPAGLSFKSINDAVKSEFKKYAEPSGSPLKYYSYGVKGNCLCLYFFLKSDLFLKAVFIVKGGAGAGLPGAGSGFDSVSQYVSSPKIALDIDDVGYDENSIDKLVSLHSVITFAIFPDAPFSRQIDFKLHESGYETIMHIPMEPVDIKLFPGDGALFVYMDRKEIKNKIDADAAMLPYIDGANNHEGSLFTSDKEKICYAVSVFKKKSMFFFDSLTDDDSYAYSCAL